MTAPKPRIRRCVGDKQLHVWVSRKWHDRLVEMAQQHKTTKAQLVRVAVKAMVEGLV
jgi:hypothetical protein